MKNKKRKYKINLLFLIILIFIFFFILPHFIPKEVFFEGVHFEGIKKNFTNESVPHNVYFTLVNPTFNFLDCNLTLILFSGDKKEQKKYDIGGIEGRKKRRYFFSFNMPRGNTEISLDKECKNNKFGALK